MERDVKICSSNMQEMPVMGWKTRGKQDVILEIYEWIATPDPPKWAFAKESFWSFEDNNRSFCAIREYN